MPLKFKCPTCGTRDSAPDELGGQKISCRHCGQKLRVPAAQPAAAAAAPPPVADVGLPAPPLPPRVPVAPAAARVEPQYECGFCHQQFGVSEVYDQQGVTICKGCFAAQQAGAIQETASGDEEASGAGEPEALVCASCGVAVPPEQAEYVGTQVMCTSCSMLAAASAAPSEPRRPRPPVQKQPPYALWIGGGAVAAVVLIGVVVVSMGHGGSRPVAVAQPPASRAPAVITPVSAPEPAPEAAPTVDWNIANLPQLVDLRRQALEQESAGNLKAAAATYGQIVKLAQSAPNPNDTVRSQLATAQAALEGLSQKLAAAAPPAPEPVKVAEAAPSAPAVPAVAQPTGTWEQQHAAQIKRLLQQAEASLTANNTFKAALCYQQLFELVGAHIPDLQDPDLRRQVSTAAIARGKLLVQVKSSPESISLTAGTLLASGIEALNEQHWQAGLESLADVRELFDRNIKLSDRTKDQNYVMALHGMAVAYLKTKQVPKAGDLFDDTAPLGAAVDRDPTRDLVINRAVVDIIQRTKALRAAKSIKAYLEKHPNDPPDETLLNLLGTSLFVAEQHTTAKGFLQQCAVLYAAQNTRLESTRPGEKRWGIEWLSAREADRKMAERQQRMDEASRAAGQAKAAYAEWERQQQLFVPHGTQHLRYTTQAAVNAAENAYNNAARAAAEAQKRVGSLPWLTELEPVLPPLPKGLTVVAAAPAETSGTGGGTETSVFSIPNITYHDTPPAGSGGSSSAGPAPAEPEPVTPRQVHIAVPRHALAFAIGKNRLISSADVIGDVAQVRMEDAQGQILSARVIAKQDHLALLELDPGQNVSHYLNLAENFVGGAVQCSAVPQENVFGPQPTMLTGQATAPSPQGGWAVSLNDHPRLPGSPLLNSDGQVVGVVVATREDARTRLPAVSIGELRQFLSANSALPTSPAASPDPLSVFEVTVEAK